MRKMICSTLLCSMLAGLAETVEVPGAGTVTVPTHQVLRTLDMEIISIVHYGLNTYADKEWGFGDTSPEIFNPPKLDVNQWMEASKAAGIRRMVFVCKHHDGFCLWPSPLNPDYTVANSPWKGGKGNLVKEVHDAALAHGIEFGAYLSPWDRHQASYATPEYVKYYHAQWDDLMSNYAPITEIWLDGANGGDGWYGGNPGKRTLPTDGWTYYEMPRLLNTLHERFPEAINFGGGTEFSMMWPGNEEGYVPENYYGFKDKTRYMPPECDTPLRKGWFWHKNDQAKSLKTLVNCYFSSVGRGGILNLGLAPNTDGLLDEGDVTRLKELGDYVRAFNAVDFAAGVPLEKAKTDAGTEYRLHLPAPTAFSAVDFREDLTKGMRISGWKFLVDGREVASGKQVGYRRIARFDLVTAQNATLVVTDCAGEPAITAVALRHAPEPIETNAAPQVTVQKADATLKKENASTLMADFGAVIRLAGFDYTPQTDGPNGMVAGYRLLVSTNGTDWRDVLSGEFGNVQANPVLQSVRLPYPLEVRFAKVVGTKAVSGEPVWRDNQIQFVK